MFDLKKTLALIQGGLLNPRETWQQYLAEGHDWKSTAILITVPLIVGSAIAATLLGALFGTGMFALGRGFFGVLFLGLLSAFLAVVVAALVFSFLAGVFQGENNFDRGFAAISLAAIPGQLGNIIATIPWIGWLIGLALFVLGLVYLYQIIPSYLKVPDSKRILHYVVSLVVSFLAMMILFALLGVGGVMSGMDMSGQAGSKMSNTSTVSGLPLGRQADLVAASSEDKYEPPEDGKVSAAQAKNYVRVMTRTAEYRQEQMDQLEKMEKEMKESGSKSTDLAKIPGGIGSVMNISFAEMEIVKTAGGNWAEHNWVKQQLRTAALQKDLNETVKHNYKVYKELVEPALK